MNVLKLHDIIEGPIGRTGPDTDIFVGNAIFPVPETEGGIVEHLVRLAEAVRKGQKIAVQRNMFGEVVAEYSSPVDGEIGRWRSGAMSEPGNVLSFILFNRPTPERVDPCPE